MTDTRPDFLTVNFAEGSAGKFLISLLMSSDSAAHYDPTVITNQDKINYIKKTFVPDLSQWLLHEPSDKLAWNINFVSNIYPRGNELSVEEFDRLSRVHCTKHFHNSVALGKKIIIPWHKKVFPLYLGNDSVSINIDKPSMRWFVKAAWSKHYAIVDDRIHLKKHDPKFYQSDSSRHLIYNNPVYLDKSLFSFLKNDIYKSEQTLFFSDRNQLRTMGSKFIIELGDLLELERLESKLKEICETFDLVPVDRSIVVAGFSHWRSLHEY